MTRRFSAIFAIFAIFAILAIFASSLGIGCFDEHSMDAEPPADLPDAYEFDSRFMAGASSVEYVDRSTEHVLIEDLVELVGQLGNDAVARERPPFADGVEPGEVETLLETLFSAAPMERAPTPILLTTMPPALQATYADLGDAVLADVLADAPPISAYLGATTPSDLVREVFSRLDVATVAVSAGERRPSPADPSADLPVHVTADGVDLKALLESFLEGAVGLWRTGARWLAEDRDPSGACVAATGLCADNAAPAGTSPHTDLEHEWDQAFGAFGAAVRYGDFPLRSLAFGARFDDSSGDGRIDLVQERNYGAAVSAAARDYDVRRAEPLDLTGDAWLGFRAGRTIITRAAGPLDATSRAALVVERDRALGAWRATVGATLVHHLNGAIGTACVCGDPAFSYGPSDFVDAAREWSLARGLVLAIELDPGAPLASGDLSEVERLLGDAPAHPLGATPEAEAGPYIERLLRARAIVGDAYHFPTRDLGDAEGESGW